MIGPDYFPLVLNYLGLLLINLVVFFGIKCLEALKEVLELFFLFMDFVPMLFNLRIFLEHFLPQLIKSLVLLAINFLHTIDKVLQLILLFQYFLTLLSYFLFVLNYLMLLLINLVILFCVDRLHALVEVFSAYGPVATSLRGNFFPYALS